ncbi:hypothetical protein ABT052_46185 [Streptomyces sp. NPDC002766]|uniref:hypothetical protein n=1 Tax=unclassified Streptomyces TaxID=2593676 RepID=UPI0033334750
MLLNRGASPATLTMKASSVSLNGSRFTLKNAWTGRVTESAGTISAAGPAHGAALFRVARAEGKSGVPHVVAGLPQAPRPAATRCRTALPGGRRR